MRRFILITVAMVLGVATSYAAQVVSPSGSTTSDSAIPSAHWSQPLTADVNSSMPALAETAIVQFGQLSTQDAMIVFAAVFLLMAIVRKKVGEG